MNRISRKIAALLVFVLVLSTSAFVSAKFSDIGGHWAESYIDKWSTAGVINGYEDGTFRADNGVTRAELSKIISLARGYTDETEVSFLDTPHSEWYISYIKRCAFYGVINGYEDLTFKPDNFVTREEAAVIFSRAYGVVGDKECGFSDVLSISDWAIDSVNAMAQNSVINGYEDNTFRPGEYITRAEIVKILDVVDSLNNIQENQGSPSDINQSQSTTTTIGGISSGSNGVGPGYSGSNGGSGSSSAGKVTVTFNSCDGIFSGGTQKKSVTISSGSSVKSYVPTEPTLDGYTFDGWYTTEKGASSLDSTKLFDTASSLKISTTLYAGYVKLGASTVTFNTNNGTPSISSIEVENGSKVSEPSESLSRNNYTFSGWYKDADLSQKFDFSSEVIKTDTTIYAGWRIDPAYADIEITIPSKTDNYISGEIVASPKSALAGENVSITCLPPDGYVLNDGSNIVVRYVTMDDEKNETEHTVIYEAKKNKFVFKVPYYIKNGSLTIQPEYSLILLPDATPDPTRDPNATPEPTEEPAPTPIIIGDKETVTWTCTSEDATKVTGDMLMPGLTTMFDVTSSGSAKVDIEGRSFTNYISSSTNGSWSGGVAAGTALKFEAWADGQLNVYVNKLGTSKKLYITKAGAENKLVVDEVNQYYTNDTEDSVNIKISLVVHKGETYYAYASGTKARFVGAGFIPAIGSTDEVPSVTTAPNPTSTPVMSGVDINAIDSGELVSTSEDGYVQVRQRASGDIIYCPAIGEADEIELPTAVGYGDKETFYVFRNQTLANAYKYTSNIPDLLVRSPLMTESEDTMEGILRVKAPYNGTLTLIYARNGSERSEGYSLYAYNGIGGEKMIVSTLTTESSVEYCEADPIEVKAGDILYFDSDWSKGIKYSYAIFEKAALSTPTSTPNPTEEPTPTTDPSTVAEVSDAVDWSFGDDTSSYLPAGTTVVGENLTYTVQAENKSQRAGGKTVNGISFPSRIKLGGGSTFDESNLDKVFAFTPAVSGEVTVYFTHAGSSGDDRYAILYQSGVKIGEKPVVAGTTEYMTVEVSGGSTVYIGGDNNIGIYGISFKPVN